MRTLSESILGSNDASVKDRIDKWYNSLGWHEERRLYEKVDDLHYRYLGARIVIDKKFKENFPAWVIFLNELNTVTINTITHDIDDLKRISHCHVKDLYVTNFSKSMIENLPTCDNLHIDNCYNLTTLPQYQTVKELHIDKCPKITSLESIPGVVDRLVVANCDGLANLDGTADKCKGSIEVIDCKNLISLEGCPEKIKGDLVVKDNTNFVNIDSFPKFVTGTVLVRKNGRDFTASEIQGRCKTRKVIV